MKNKENFRRRLVKAYYAIKGWSIARKMKVGEYYSSEHIKNSRFMYRGKHLFYEAYAASPAPGVVYTGQRKRTFNYWQIGILKFKKG